MDTGRPCALLANWHATIVGPTGDAGLEQFVGNDVGDQLAHSQQQRRQHWSVRGKESVTEVVW